MAYSFATTSVQHRSRRCGATRSYWRRREATAKRRSSWRPMTTTSGSRSRWRRCCTSASRRLNLSATTRRRPCGPTTLTFIRAAGPSRTPSASPRPATCSRRRCRYSPSSSGGAASCSRAAACRAASSSTTSSSRRTRRTTARPSTRTRGGAGSSARRVGRVRSRLFARVDGVDASTPSPRDRRGSTRLTASFNAVEAAAADGRARVQALRAGRLLAEDDAAALPRRPRDGRGARATLAELPERARGARLVDARRRRESVRARGFCERLVVRPGW